MTNYFQGMGTSENLVYDRGTWSRFYGPYGGYAKAAARISDTEILVFGGYHNNQQSKFNDIWNLEKGHWDRTGEDLPFKMYGMIFYVQKGKKSKQS